MKTTRIVLTIPEEHGDAESGGDAAGVQLAAESAVMRSCGEELDCTRMIGLQLMKINQHPSGSAGRKKGKQ